MTVSDLHPTNSRRQQHHSPATQHQHPTNGISHTNQTAASQNEKGIKEEKKKMNNTTNTTSAVDMNQRFQISKRGSETKDRATKVEKERDKND